MRAHQANSHAGQGWEVFTAAVLSAVTEMAGSKGVVIMAWGAHAGRMIGGLNTVGAVPAATDGGRNGTSC